MKPSGYVKIHRKMLVNPVLNDHAPFNRQMAWLWMILNANYESYKRKWSGKNVTIPPGSIVMSKRELCRIFRWGNRRLNTFLNDLISASMMTMQMHHRQHHIILSNYKDLQNMRTATAQQPRTQPHRFINGSKRNNNKEEYIHVENSPDFDEFWKLYGKKIGSKVKCRKYFEGDLMVMDKYQITLEDHKKILAHIPKFKKSVSDMQYLPHPSTYLFQRMWESELDIDSAESEIDAIQRRDKERSREFLAQFK